MSRTLQNNLPSSTGSPTIKGCAAGTEGPLFFPCQGWVASDLKASPECHTPLAQGLLVTAHAPGRFSPHKALAALETQAQVTLKNFVSLPRVKNSLSCCRPELELPASGPGRKNHAVWLGSEVPLMQADASRC